MELITVFKFLPALIGFTSTAVGVILTIRSTSMKTALSNYKELVESYEKRDDQLKEQIESMKKQIKALQKRIDEVEKIPLRNIDSRLEVIEESILAMLKTQTQMSELMTKKMSK